MPANYLGDGDTSTRRERRKKWLRLKNRKASMDKKEIMIRNCIFSFQCKGKWEKMELFKDGIDASMAFF